MKKILPVVGFQFTLSTIDKDQIKAQFKSAIGKFTITSIV